MYKLSGAKVFTTLDASSGYWQLVLEEDSSKLTKFITPYGRYRFRRLPLGICSASEIFQRRMTSLLERVPAVEMYQDDIIVYGSCFEEHDARLNSVLEAISKSVLKFNREK